jgi:hypothetical protein
MLEEHRQVHFYLDQISHSLSRLEHGVTDVEPMRRLAAQLQGLKERLSEHQQSEEEGGMFQAILEVLPAQRVEIDRLHNQHAKMIEILEMARIHAQRSEVGEAQSLRVDLQRFLDMFREHERTEERLLEQAMQQEGIAVD